MSGIVGRYGYIIDKQSIDATTLENLRKDLTVAAKVNPMFQPPATPFRVFGETQQRIYLPRFYGNKRFGIPAKKDITFPCIHPFSTPNLRMNPSFQPLEQQKPALRALLTSLSKTGGGILSLQCGGGKTYCGLFTACALKLKTLIIVHKEFLLDQWVERIEQFIPNAKIGRIQAKVYDIEGKDFVIGMLQSISMKDELTKKMFSMFGTVICDEAHHISAETFSRALPKIATKYMIGLTATPTRDDGLTKVFKWFLGDVCYKAKQAQHAVIVRVIEYRPANESRYIAYDKRGQFSQSKTITKLKDDMSRNVRVAKEIVDIYLEGRQNLIVSERKEHLVVLEKCIQSYFKELRLHAVEKPEIGYYVGQMKKEERDKSATRMIILGTIQMVEEALDIATLNTITLTTPLSSKKRMFQSIGRILRKVHKDKPPLVVDIQDKYTKISMYTTRFNKRCDFYFMNNYKILLFKLDNTIVELTKESSKNKKSHNGPIGKCLLMED